MRVYFDKKGRPITYLRAEEARLAISFADQQGVEPEYELGADIASDKWLIMRLVRNTGASSALVRGMKWHRTSFRVQKEVWDAFVMLARDRGLTSCQVLRAGIDSFVGLEEQAQARKRMVYVG